MKLGLALIALLALRASAGAAGSSLREPEVISFREIDGESAWTIRARAAAADRLLAELAARSNRTLAGLDGIDPQRLRESVAVELLDRPLPYVVQVLAGSIGARARLGADTIELFPDVDVQSSAEEIDEQTAVAWMRFLKAHPEHELASRGEMALGELYERAGNLVVACAHYALVARNHPHSTLAADALLQAGLLHGRLGDWAAAAERLTELANLERPHAHQARARLELARALAQLGDGRQAGFLLDALEGLFPAATSAERRTRLYVRARALGAEGRHPQALETLEQADAAGPEHERDPDAMELRAAALEGIGRPAEAARAWLAHARVHDGAARERGLVEAARLALAAGDDLGVLFVEKLAGATPAVPALSISAARARENLGLAGLARARMHAEDLARAEDLLVARGFARARSILERLWREREVLDNGGRIRLALAYARALDAEEGLESALTILRAALSASDDVEGRRRILVQAGELFERHDRFDEAIAAYGGSL